MRFRLEQDTGPDALGRCHFTLHWLASEYRPQLHPDGFPVGYRRGQCYFARPEDVIQGIRDRGHVVELAPDARPASSR